MKSITRKLRGQYFREAVIYFLTFCLVLNTSLPAVMALESGDVISSSGAAVTMWGDHTIIDTDHGAIINWNNFNTSATQSVTFNQSLGGELSSLSAVLNRINSGAVPTQFNGALNANGHVFIVNPAGVIFGAGSMVDVAQLVASSLDIADGDFLAGNYEFHAGGANGAVINNGAISASEGAALIGKRVLNAGTITTGNGGFVVMAAGDRVLLGEPGSKIVVEMDSVTPAEEGDGTVVNNGQISSPAGTVVLAAGDIFSVPLQSQLRVNSGTVEEPVYEVADQPVRVESGIGAVTQSGTINADGIDGDGGSVVLTAGDEVILGAGSSTTANGGTSNSGANGGEVVAYASEVYADNALVDFQTGAQIEVTGGSPSDPATIDAGATFEGGLAELSGDHLYFNGSVDATSQSYVAPDPANPGSTITVTPEGGTLHIDPVSLTLADGAIPAGGAAIDTFYEKELEAYSQAGIDTILEADYDITVENISDGYIDGGTGDIALRTIYNTGDIEFLPATIGGAINTIVRTVGGGNIYMLAGSGGIKTGSLQTYEDGGNPGRIRIFTNNGGDIQTGALLVDGGNDVEVSVIASGNLTINGSVVTSTNKVPSKEDQVGTAYVCLVSDNGSVNILGAVQVEAHGKQETVARIHICADNTVTVHTGSDRLQATAKTSSAGTADATIRIHAASSEPGAISIIRSSGDPIRIQAYTSGSTINQDFTGAEVDNEQTSGGSHVLVQIADTWLEACPDCPAPPDMPPPIEPPQHSPIAVDDDYVMNKGDILLIILDADGVLTNDYDPDEDMIIALLLGSGDTTKGGTVVLDENGGFTYTAPTDKQFDTYGSDAGGDYALFTDSFEYNLQDEGGLNSNSATVTITAKNYVPVAQADSYDVTHNVNLSPAAGQGIITGVVPAVNGDTDADGDTLTPYLSGGLTTGSTALGGTVTLNSDGSFSYDPPVDTVGTDSFTYYASDGYNNSTPVEVTIDVTNTVPVAQADSYNVVHNVDLSAPVDQGIITGVVPAINGDTDADGDTLTPYLLGGSTSGTTDLGGTITLNPDGSFTYNPPADMVGTDSFTYYVNDGYDNSAPVQVSIEVGNTSPVAQPDSYNVLHNATLSTEAGQGIIIGVVPAVNGDSDADGDALTPYLPGALTTGPTALGGTVTLNPDGSFTYTPPTDTVGADSFTYYVTDGYSSSSAVQVTIDLTNTLPVAQPDSYTVGFDTSLSPVVGQGLIVGVVPTVNGDYDLDPGDSLSPYLQDGLTSGATAHGGTVTLNPDGSFAYTPASGWEGADSFTYYVTDGYGNSEPVLVTMLVGEAPPVPVIPSIPAAPGLEPVRIEMSGCPALMVWAAAELGVNESALQIRIASGLASGMAIQPCDACTSLKQAATILQDSEGAHIAALAQVVNELASNTAPPTEEQMASIASAIAMNVGADNQYAVAGQYLDALAKYVGILNNQMGFSTAESIQLATDKYVGPLAEGQNAGVAAYVAARLAALGG